MLVINFAKKHWKIVSLILIFVATFMFWGYDMIASRLIITMKYNDTGTLQTQSQLEYIIQEKSVVLSEKIENFIIRFTTKSNINDINDLVLRLGNQGGTIKIEYIEIASRNTKVTLYGKEILKLFSLNVVESCKIKDNYLEIFTYDTSLSELKMDMEACNEYLANERDQAKWPYFGIISFLAWIILILFFQKVHNSMLSFRQQLLFAISKIKLFYVKQVDFMKQSLKKLCIIFANLSVIKFFHGWLSNQKSTRIIKKFNYKVNSIHSWCSCNVSTFFYNKQIPIILILFIIVFFGIPIKFSYDSSIYISYLKIFNGEYSWGIWGKTRGWGYPFFLWISSIIFGDSAYGFALSCFIIYIIFLMCIAAIITTMAKERKFNGCFCLIILFFLNPIMLGYFHIMLTEPLAATITIFLIYWVFKCVNYRVENCASKSNMIKEIVVIAVLTAWLFNIKQMFFIIPIIVFLLSEIYLLITQKSKPLILFSGIAFTGMVLLCAYIGWNNFIAYSAERDQVNIQDSVYSGINANSEDLFHTYFIQGALNFEYDQEQQCINVFKDNVIIDTIEYREKINPITYIAKCFLRHPILLLEGYFEGYGALTNLYKLTPTEGKPMSQWDIVKDISFTRGTENATTACRFSAIEENFSTYEDSGVQLYENLIGRDQLIYYGQYADSNIITKSIYSGLMIDCADFSFTFSLIYAPISMIVHFLFIWKGRKKRSDLFHYKQFVLSGTAFLYGMAISMMSMHIDRYMFPVYALALLALCMDVISIYNTTKNGIIKNNKNFIVEKME